MKPITLSIDCTKIKKELLGKGKYLNLILWENKTTDQWGNTHGVKQSLTKVQRESGIEVPFIGNAKVPKGEPAGSSAPPPRRPAAPPPKTNDPDLDQPEDDIPF